MATRRFPKPKREMRRGMLSSFSNFLDEHQSLITGCSVLVAGLGVCIAAISTVIAWKQVQFVQSERYAPYRVALYQQRIQSMQEILEAMAAFNRESTCIKIRFLDYPDLQDEDSRHECIDTAMKTADLSEQQIMKSAYIWPRRSRDLMTNYAVSSRTILFCASAMHTFEDYEKLSQWRQRCQGFRGQLENLTKMQSEASGAFLADLSAPIDLLDGRNSQRSLGK